MKVILRLSLTVFHLVIPALQNYTAKRGKKNQHDWLLCKFLDHRAHYTTCRCTCTTCSRWTAPHDNKTDFCVSIHKNSYVKSTCDLSMPCFFQISNYYVYESIEELSWWRNAHDPYQDKLSHKSQCVTSIQSLNPQFNPPLCFYVKSDISKLSDQDKGTVMDFRI